MRKIRHDVGNSFACHAAIEGQDSAQRSGFYAHWAQLPLTHTAAGALCLTLGSSLVCPLRDWQFPIIYETNLKIFHSSYKALYNSALSCHCTFISVFDSLAPSTLDQRPPLNSPNQSCSVTHDFLLRLGMSSLVFKTQINVHILLITLFPTNLSFFPLHIVTLAAFWICVYLHNNSCSPYLSVILWYLFFSHSGETLDLSKSSTVSYYHAHNCASYLVRIAGLHEYCGVNEYICKWMKVLNTF